MYKKIERFVSICIGMENT